jgi:DnaK suppressor protein
MTVISEARCEELRRVLNAERRRLQSDVRSRVRDARVEKKTDGVDDVENSGTGIEGDIEFSLIQMKSEALGRVEAALARLDSGTYGNCVSCQGEISETRLRALPFALRCRACEERREQDQVRARQDTDKHGSPSLFAGSAGY